MSHLEGIMLRLVQSAVQILDLSLHQRPVTLQQHGRLLLQVTVYVIVILHSVQLPVTLQQHGRLLLQVTVYIVVTLHSVQLPVTL